VLHFIADYVSTHQDACVIVDGLTKVPRRYVLSDSLPTFSRTGVCPAGVSAGYWDPRT
jgi:hypothetical protein